MNREIYRITGILAVLLTALSCSDDKEDKGPDGGGNTGVGDPNAPRIDELDENDICYDVEQGIDEVTSRVMLLEDVSGSMDDGLEGWRGPSKWEIAVDAIASMVNTYEESIQFGLDLFPSPGGDDSCDVSDPVRADVQYSNAQNIIDILDDDGPDGATPLLLGISNFLDASYASGFTSGEPGGYLVVISDGMDTCGPEGVWIDNDIGADAAQLATATETLLSTHGIQTFVIGFGFGDEDTVDAAQLDAIAQAGGTQFDTFFDAQNEDELNEALSSIGQAVIVSCQYQLGAIPDEADRSNTNIYFDGLPLGRGNDCSGEADWIWSNDDMTVIEFCPAACDMLENDQVDNLQVIIMCSPADVVVVV